MQKIARFCIFLGHSANKFQVPANRTIMTPAAQPIAHFEHYAPNFARKIFILMTLLKFGSQQAPKSVDPESCHSKMLLFVLFFVVVVCARMIFNLCPRWGFKYESVLNRLDQFSH